MSDSDPIVAISTPIGNGGIGIIRISGNNLSDLIINFFKFSLIPRYAYYLPFKKENNEILDQGIAIFFQAPNSYTGEDVLELHGHGGSAVLQQILDLCIFLGQKIGVRLAEPGEFTRRAFLNGKIDLAQAEAVSDLINASTVTAARGAIASLTGQFSLKINKISKAILELRSLVEAILDFPEEDIKLLETYQIREKLYSISCDFEFLFSNVKQGIILRDGLYVVIIGRPNVGKSSLINALSEDDAAIVTSIPGTTRDKIIKEIQINGVLMRISDTAGLRETKDVIENIGIQNTWKEIKKADIILHLQDVTNMSDKFDREIISSIPANTPVLKVFNKIDLLKKNSIPSIKEGIMISAKNEDGLDTLRMELLKISGWNTNIESPWLARKRHLDILKNSANHLELAKIHAEHGDQALDLFAEELRIIHENLSHITGKLPTDDLLNEIFSSFCIGK